MKITYDAKADAAYIYLTESRDTEETQTRDYEIMLDFSSQKQLNGIEVLNASRKLDLPYLRPFIDKLDGPVFRWFHLAWEIDEMIRKGIPIEATNSHGKAWAEDVKRDVLKIRFDGSNDAIMVTRKDLESMDIMSSYVISDMGIMHTLYEMGRPQWPSKPHVLKVE